MNYRERTKAQPLNPTDVVQVTQDDVRFPFRLRNHSSDVPTFQQVFIKQEYDFLVETPPKVIVDAGANIGLASIYFANKYPTAKIIAVEPEQSNFQLLKSNTAPYETILPVQAALWNHNGKINLVDPGLGHWAFMTEDENTGEHALGAFRHQVKAMTVDRIIADHGLDRIDVLKIDIEGAEREVFQDTSAWIDRVDALIVELHERMKPGCNRSFLQGAKGFDNQWRQGENLYLSRGARLTRKV